MILKDGGNGKEMRRRESVKRKRMCACMQIIISCKISKICVNVQYVVSLMDIFCVVKMINN